MRKRLTASLIAMSAVCAAMSSAAYAGTVEQFEEMIKAQQTQLQQQQQMLQQMQRELTALRKETQHTSKQLSARTQPRDPVTKPSSPSVASVQTAKAVALPPPASGLETTESQAFKPVDVSYYDQIGDFYATPVADLDAATDEYVRLGGRPKAWKIPGTGLDLSIGGYAKADFIYGIDGETSGAEDLFVVPAIVTDGSSGTDDRARFHGRESRLNFDVTGDSEYGLIRAFIEGDFFGAGGNEIVSNSDSFRLRHAFVQVGGLLAGQTWTTFMDVSAIPNTLDFEGPGAESFLRQGQVRYTHDAGDGLTIAVAAENPESRVQDGIAGTSVISSVRDTLPDFIARVRYDQPWGHLQLAGLVRNADAPSGFSDETGYAVAGSGKINVPFLGERDNLRFQAIYTDGASRFVLDGAIAAGDIATGPGGQSDTIEIVAAYGAFQHYWMDNLRSTVVGSYVEIDRPGFFIGPGALKTSTYIVGNLIWSPVSNVDLGVELQYGEREDEDGDDGDASRVQSSAIFRF